MISKTLGTPWEHISNTAGSSSTTASSRVKLFMVRIGDEKHEVYTSHDSDRKKTASMCQKRPSMCQRRPIVCQRDLLCVKRDLVCVKRDLACVKGDPSYAKET